VTRFLDTNILLRHLLNDHPVHSPASFALIQAVERRTLTVWTSNLAIAEVVFVLSIKRTYNLPREDVRDRLLPLIDLPSLKLANKRVYHRAFDLYVSLAGLSFVDAYHAALLERRSEPELYSFDTDFDDIHTVRRVEP
jgi:predicted nucleic acid-binding protein